MPPCLCLCYAGASRALCVAVWWNGLPVFALSLLSLGPRQAPGLGEKWAGITGFVLYSEPSKLGLSSRLRSLCPA